MEVELFELLNSLYIQIKTKKNIYYPYNFFLFFLKSDHFLNIIKKKKIKEIDESWSMKWLLLAFKLTVIAKIIKNTFCKVFLLKSIKCKYC